MPTPSLFRDALAGSVRAELARRRISIRQAAQITGMSRSTMTRRLRDGRFTIDALAAIADHCDVLVSDLIPSDDDLEPVSA